MGFHFSHFLLREDKQRSFNVSVFTGWCHDRQVSFFFSPLLPRKFAFPGVCIQSPHYSVYLLHVRTMLTFLSFSKGSSPGGVFVLHNWRRSRSEGRGEVCCGGGLVLRYSVLPLKTYYICIGAHLHSCSLCWYVAAVVLPGHFFFFFFAGLFPFAALLLLCILTFFPKVCLQPLSSPFSLGPVLCLCSLSPFSFCLPCQLCVSVSVWCLLNVSHRGLVQK